MPPRSSARSVVNLAERRAARERVDLAAKWASVGMGLSADARLETARVALAELQLRYAGILATIREPLLQAIELALLDQRLRGEGESYVQAVALALQDLRHCGVEREERVDDCKASLPAVRQRLRAMKLL